MTKIFTKNLLQWHDEVNEREMPWKGELNPYKIWLSEVILQQTRVEQGWNYYQKFIEHYPTIAHLAKAKEKEVFKLWEGLGYYNRCKNLLFTAKFICEKYNGVFPASYNEILQLKGIGPYTAAAIASFAYQLPHAVVDGNVYRVLSRYFEIETPVDTNEGKKEFEILAQNLLDKNNPSAYNQAIMDFGAIVCKPKAPECINCPLKRTCKAYKNDTVFSHPVKLKKLIKKERWLYYFILEYGNKIYVHQRSADDIWQNLHEFYLLENDTELNMSKGFVKKWLQENLNIRDAVVEDISGQYKQTLTHQYLKGQFIHIRLKTLPAILKKTNWIDKKKLKNLAFPQLINQYLYKSHSPFLEAVELVYCF